MKLLLDANLSRRLIPLIQDLFPGSLHVSATALATDAADQTIWQYAHEKDFVLVTADKDFLALAKNAEAPKVVILANCDYPTAEAARLIRSNAVRITELARQKRSLLVLRKP
jgi:predicted nuclease of predicted toxin-antitoxin system